MRLMRGTNILLGQTFVSWVLLCVLGGIPTWGGTAPSPVPIRALAAGADHTCALLADGSVRCWGNNEAGQLGNGTAGGPSRPVTVSGITTATAIAAGSSYTCALLADGTVRCWGANFFGQLGNRAVPYHRSPVPVTGLAGAIAIAAGGSHSCAVLADGTLRCWGANLMGQLGDGSTRDSSTPVQVAEIATATAIAAGGSHTCAVLREGAVRCWGGNVSGQLGDESTRDSRIPVPVVAISTGTAVAAGVFHTCASLAEGRVKCWGNSESGQLSNGVNILRSTTPVTVAGITTARGVGAGLSHTCVLVADGTVRCAGGNGSGQLGCGLTPDESSDPVAARGVTAAIALSVGGSHACAILADGSVRCWGANDSGQLGEGNTASLPSPRPVPGLR